MDTEDTKKRFAAAWAQHPDDVFKAALSVLGDAGLALASVRQWEHDPDVIALRDELAHEAQAARLEGMRERVLLKLEDAMDKCINYEVKSKIGKVILDATKEDAPGAGAGNTFIQNNRVLVLTDHGTDDEWLAKLRAQQARLIEDANRPAAVN